MIPDSVIAKHFDFVYSKNQEQKFRGDYGLKS